MNRRFLSLLLIFITGLALWVTRNWWLPWLLAQLPRIQANADLIQTVEALVNIAALIFSGVIAYLLWLNRPGAAPTPDGDLQDAILTRSNVSRLLDALGQGADLNWIDRGAVRPADLPLHGRVVITGRSGLGKTREAIELIRRAVDDDLILPDRIFRPGPALRFVNPETFANNLARSFDPYLPALLFVDDLPYHFIDDGLARLANLIDALALGKSLYVVATARSDQLTAGHNLWLEQQCFHSHPLSALSAAQTGRLVDSAAGLLSLQVPDDTRHAFAEHSDGTPQHPLVALRLLRQQGRQRITIDDAREALSDSAVQAWAATRRYIIEPHRVPAAAHILDALAYFHVARLPTYRSLIIPFAARLARSAGSPRGHRRHHTLEQALKYLAKFDIRTVDRIVVHRDEIAAFAPPEEAVLDRLTAFLTRHPRIFYPLMRRFFTATADEHRAAVFALAYFFQERQDQGRAIAAYRQAIALDPQDAIPHNNLGAVYHALGRHEEAIVAYRQASALDPQFAYPHNNLGNVYHALGRHEEAMAAYRQAIALDPQYAYPHNGLGNVYHALGRHEEAIAAYRQASALDPKGAAPRAGLAAICRKRGDIQGYQEHADSARKLLAQERGYDEYALACFAAIFEDTEEALALLQAAIAKAPGKRTLAQRDPDFDFIRDDPRFQAMVGD